MEKMKTISETGEGKKKNNNIRKKKKEKRTMVKKTIPPKARLHALGTEYKKKKKKTKGWTL
jgi:hypothetical protein